MMARDLNSICMHVGQFSLATGTYFYHLLGWESYYLLLLHMGRSTQLGAIVARLRAVVLHSAIVWLSY
jgi:hypothetical protein